MEVTTFHCRWLLRSLRHRYRYSPIEIASLAAVGAVAHGVRVGPSPRPSPRPYHARSIRFDHDASDGRSVNGNGHDDVAVTERGVVAAVESFGEEVPSVGGKLDIPSRSDLD